MAKAALTPLAQASTILEAAKARYTTKEYDASRPISSEDLAKVRELLQFSPSSTNAQPWHFILATTPEGKKRVAKGTEGPYDFNTPKIMDAGAAVVFASRTELSDEFLARVLEVEGEDGRFASDPEALAKQTDDVRKMFINMNRDAGKLAEWNARQTYLNIGQFMLGAAAMGLDTTPMEGIDCDALDKEFGFAEKGLRSLCIVSLGYRAESDFNAALPKSRLPFGEIITEI